MRVLTTARALRVASRSLRIAVILLALALTLLPIFWMTVTSFKAQSEIFRFPPTLFPLAPTWGNYAEILGSGLTTSIAFLRYFRNSLVVALGTVAATLLLATPASYAFSRLPFRAKRGFIYFILISQMLPVVLILIPLYTALLRLKLLSSYVGLVLPYLMFTLPFSIWMLKGYFDTIPRELDEAAKVDGCTKMQAMLRVVLPNVKPGITATAIVTFIQAWDEFMISLTIMDKDAMRTLPVGIIQTFVGEFTIKWGQMMAASVVATIPVVLLFVFLSRYLIGGLVTGAVKG
jgi:multiple sugar transport system permease protein